MRIVFHERYLQEYASDPAARRGRIDRAVEELRPRYDFLEPNMAEEEDILLVHEEHHLRMIAESPQLHSMALLAAGGAIEASELAMQGEPTFALIRPPGHHASPGDCWGFCWYNNVAVAVERLRQAGRIRNAFILDFDLHFGDGTNNFFQNIPHVTYYHSGSLQEIATVLKGIEECDLVGVSAGFDRHVEDWGGTLTTENYRSIGGMVRSMTQRLCPGRVFAVLEGGYNERVLGDNILAFLQGLEGEGIDTGET
ncbi:MAG: histone deacetylase family protein [Desulfohalobiaceae bacterium]|nr:histone deacetylase family protein [Desulfohalobiaceae bacterium]